MVISQTWLRAGNEHVEAYLRLVGELDAFLRAQPGFIRRQLIQSIEDPRHIIHLRTFATVTDYETMTTDEDYRSQIAQLSEHVDAQAYPEGAVGREYGEILFETP